MGVGSNAVILSKNRLFSISFPLEFPVYEAESTSMKDQVSFNLVGSYRVSGPFAFSYNFFHFRQQIRTQYRFQRILFWG